MNVFAAALAEMGTGEVTVEKSIVGSITFDQKLMPDGGQTPAEINTTNGSKSETIAHPDRSVIWDDGVIVAFDVPENAKLFTPEHKTDLRYCRVGMKVKKSGDHAYAFLNVYVHDSEPGARVVGKLSVHEKIMPDGQTFLHVDIHPVSIEREPTHRLIYAFHDKQLHSRSAGATVVFPAGKGLEGGIVIKAIT